jgi:anti-anti-sigma regulatory factor
MLRVTAHVEDTTITLQLEGRLAGPTVIEAERCWQVTCAENPGRSRRLDLRAVTYLDQEGKAFLRRVFQQGANFLSSGCLTRAYVEEIIRSGK